MIKCIHDQCQWPECDKTCGLVPTGDYVAGSCAEEGLIAHLQQTIQDMHLSLNETRLLVLNCRLSLQGATKSLQSIAEHMAPDNYVPTCLHGYCDCVYDPAYIRKYHLDWWIDLGMPTSCKNCPNGERYDDEDK